MLQQLLPEPYQHISLDQFRDGLPIRYRGLNSPNGSSGAEGINIIPVQNGDAALTRIEFGRHGEQVLKAMRRSVAKFNELGLNTIIDDLLFKPDYLLDYAKVLDTKHSWVVGVHCSIDEVNRRESDRIGRFPGTALEHMERVHAHGITYDIEVDTTTLSPMQAARVIIKGLADTPITLDQATRTL